MILSPYMLYQTQSVITYILLKRISQCIIMWVKNITLHDKEHIVRRIKEHKKSDNLTEKLSLLNF